MRPDEIERQFRESRTRTLRHWYDDGLAESFVGLVFIVVALCFAAQILLRNTRGLANVTLNLLFPALVICACLFGGRLVRRVKERYVYPRTGFVAYQKPGSVPKWLSGALGGAIAGLTVALIRTAPEVEAWIPAFEGFVLGAFMLWQGRYTGLARLTLVGLLAALLGLLISFGGFSTNIAGILLFGAFGAFTLAGGCLAFRRFLREAPRPEES